MSLLAWPIRMPQTAIRGAAHCSLRHSLAGFRRATVPPNAHNATQPRPSPVAGHASGQPAAVVCAGQQFRSLVVFCNEYTQPGV